MTPSESYDLIARALDDEKMGRVLITAFATFLAPVVPVDRRHRELLVTLEEIRQQFEEQDRENPEFTPSAGQESA